jgi:hypothetical protein
MCPQSNAVLALKNQPPQQPRQSQTAEKSTAPARLAHGLLAVRKTAFRTTFPYRECLCTLAALYKGGGRSTKQQTPVRTPNHRGLRDRCLATPQISLQPHKPCSRQTTNAALMLIHPCICLAYNSFLPSY